MIEECLEIFKENLERKGERFILDRYLPKPGTYIFIEMNETDWEIKTQVTIQFNKKTGEIEGKNSTYYQDICYLDYYSKLIEMNKPIDSAKIIHSNNYLSFAIKKESLENGKLTDEVIDNYYNVLKDPKVKYKKPSSLKLYEEVERELGNVDQVLLEKIQIWVKQNIRKLEIEVGKKDYLKIFFVYPDINQTKRMYEQEGTRYIAPNIYNNNDFNQEIDGKIYGLPNNNLGMNAKKKFLENKSRKVKVPYLANQKEVLLQTKFYDYLMALASKGYCNIYFDSRERRILECSSGKGPRETLSGYYLRIEKRKEVEIHNVDTVIRYNPNMEPIFHYTAMLKTEQMDSYGTIEKRERLEQIMDEVFFGKSLIYNYFTPVQDMIIKDGVLLNNITIARDQLFTWFYKDEGVDVSTLLDQVSKSLIKNSILKGYWKKTKHQLNLRWSLADYFSGTKRMEETMNKVQEELWEHIQKKEEWEFSGDEEYYFAVGQMVSYFISRSKGKKKPLSFVNPFANAKNDTIIKKHLGMLFIKYNYDIEYNSTRVNGLYSNIMLYKPKEKVNIDMILAGVTANNLIYRKEKEEN